MIPSSIFMLLIILVGADRCQSQPQQPNVIIIITDQQQAKAIGRAQEELGIPNQSRIQTPNMDRLSYEGAYFRNAYTHCAVCGPARASLLMGRTIQNTGVRTNKLTKESLIQTPGNDAAQKLPQLRTFDEILVKDMNYNAEYYGKWHSPESKGFVYSNDVRMAGASNVWFGKTNPDGSRRLSIGMMNEYRAWLDENNFPAVQPVEGQQENKSTKRPYIPDPLDGRFGKPPGTPAKSQDSLMGKDLLPNGFSITGRQAIESLDAIDRLHQSGNPFSITISFHSPHSPFVATQKYHEMYNPNDMVVPESLSDKMLNSPYRQRREEESSGYLEPSKLQRWTATYYGLITEIDEWIGILLDKLEDLGIDGSTLIIFTSDHGEMLGAHGMKSKNVFYEESVAIPLILRMPDQIPSNTVVDDPVSHLDLHSTILDYTGGTPIETDGNSLRRLIERTASDEDIYVVSEWNFTDSTRPNFQTKDPAFMIRKGNWKLIMPGTAESSALDMLIDLSADPLEMTNLVGQDSSSATDATLGKAEHLKALIVRRLVETGHPSAEAMNQRRTWRALDLWVGDTSLDFGWIGSDGTKSQWLYIGSASEKGANGMDVALEGWDADRYEVDWNFDEIPPLASRRAKITYKRPNVCSRTPAMSSTSIVISYGGEGVNLGTKFVELTRPRDDFSTTRSSLYYEDFEQPVIFFPFLNRVEFSGKHSSGVGRFVGETLLRNRTTATSATFVDIPVDGGQELKLRALAGFSGPLASNAQVLFRLMIRFDTGLLVKAEPHYFDNEAPLLEYVETIVVPEGATRVDQVRVRYRIFSDGSSDLNAFVDCIEIE